MTTANYITVEDLRKELASALAPVNERLSNLERGLSDVQERVGRIENKVDHAGNTLNDVRMRTNQMYDALEQSGVSLPSRTT